MSRFRWVFQTFEGIDVLPVCINNQRSAHLINYLKILLLTLRPNEITTLHTLQRDIQRCLGVGMYQGKVDSLSLWPGTIAILIGFDKTPNSIRPDLLKKPSLIRKAFCSH